MKLRLPRCCGGLAFAALCAMPVAAAAQIPGGEAVKLTSDQVMALETALAQLNFDPGKIDGVIDGRTRAAIRLYQDFAALPADAKATPALLAEVLSVAKSFTEIQAPRASQAAAEPPDETPEPPDETPEPAKAAEAPKEPEAEIQQAVEPPDETPEPAKAAEAPKEPEAETQQAVAPPDATPEPAKAAEAPKEPEAAAPPVEQVAPKDPSPPEKKTVPGYNIGSVISRLAAAGNTSGKSPEPDTRATPDAVPPSDRAGNEQRARVPAPAKPTSTPGKPTDGYAAFLDAYKAAQAGDYEYAARRYGDAIQSKKLTLEHLGDAYFNRANVHHILGLYDKSIADYGVTIGAKPSFAGAYYNRGFSFQAKGDLARAVEDFRRARDLGLQRLGVRAPDRMPPLR